MITAMQSGRLEMASKLYAARTLIGGAKAFGGVLATKDIGKLLTAMDLVDEVLAKLVPNEPASKEGKS